MKEITIKRVENGFYVMVGNFNECAYPKQYVASSVIELENLIGSLAHQLIDAYEATAEKDPE